jgi:hypothetical protein
MMPPVISRKPNRILRAWSIAYLICSALALSPSPAGAEDHFLTIGGGSSPSNNQVSLEKNILYLQRFLADTGLGNLPHEILFSDGAAGARDLQFLDPNHQAPKANQLLAEIFRQEDGLDLQYRPHAIPHLWGPSGRSSIGKWFDTVGAKLHDADRLFIYYTGHGGRNRQQNFSTMAMWNEADMPVREFVKLLDKLPKKVSVVLVMVQCYGGGFGDVIFEGADSSKGLSSANRCGFFATSPDRIAAGCTPDVDEENYREYSTYFWAALYGRKRTGEAVPAPDYNKDGHVSLAEAHAWSLVNSDTIDLSMKTSDVFLRRYGKMKTVTASRDLIDTDSGYQTLLDKADPPERATLEGLAQRLDLEGSNRTQAARNLAEVLRKRRKTLGDEQKRLRDLHDANCRTLAVLVKRRWPELSNAWNPSVATLLSSDADQIVRMIESAPQYAELHKQDDRLDELEEQMDDLERKWVKCQRFIKTAEHVALAANLPSVAAPELVERYHQLIAAEGGVLNTVRK